MGTSNKISVVSLGNQVKDNVIIQLKIIVCRYIWEKQDITEKVIFVHCGF